MRKGCDKYTNQEGCPVKIAMDSIGGKWKIFIVWQLLNNPMIRYNELKRKISNITDTMLSQCLKELMQNGIVERVQYNEIPPRVEYCLTENGKQLENVLIELAKWGQSQTTIKK